MDKLNLAHQNAVARMKAARKAHGATSVCSAAVPISFLSAGIAAVARGATDRLKDVAASWPRAGRLQLVFGAPLASCFVAIVELAALGAKMDSAEGIERAPAAEELCGRLGDEID